MHITIPLKDCHPFGCIIANRVNYEHELKTLEYIPIVSTLFGTIRGLALTVRGFRNSIRTIKHLANTFFYALSRNADKLTVSKAVLKTYAVLTLHDITSVFRSLVCIVPIAGNILLWSYDRIGLRFEYNPPGLQSSCCCQHPEKESTGLDESNLDPDAQLITSEAASIGSKVPVSPSFVKKDLVDS